MKKSVKIVLLVVLVFALVVISVVPAFADNMYNPQDYPLFLSTPVQQIQWGYYDVDRPGAGDIYLDWAFGIGSFLAPTSAIGSGYYADTYYPSLGVSSSGGVSSTANDTYAYLSGNRVASGLSSFFINAVVPQTSRINSVYKSGYGIMVVQYGDIICQANDALWLSGLQFGMGYNTGVSLHTSGTLYYYDSDQVIQKYYFDNTINSSPWVAFPRVADLGFTVSNSYYLTNLRVELRYNINLQADTTYYTPHIPIFGNASNNDLYSTYRSLQIDFIDTYRDQNDGDSPPTGDWEDGYVAGWDQGYDTGYEVGDGVGYQRGVETQLDSLDFSAYFSVILGSIWNFSVVGNVTFGALLSFVIGLALFLVFLKLFI